MDSRDEFEISGTIESIVYNNPDNGYTVFTIALSDSGNAEDDELTCIAYSGQLNPGESVKLTGTYVLHSLYGRQFNVSTLEQSIPTTRFGIEKYLGSGAIKGIGEKLAKKIVDKFKDETFVVIENTPERLADIRGITVEKALAIGAIFREQTIQRAAIMFLNEKGITTAFAKKVYDKYKEDTINIVSSNPYKLADEISGVGFKTADSIAMRMGFDTHSPFRIAAGVRYVLSLQTANGHVYMPKPLLLEQAAEMLSVSFDELETSIIQMQMDRRIRQEKIGEEIAVYLSQFHYAESYIAKKLVELNSFFTASKAYTEQDALKIEEKYDVTLAERQRDAVIESMNSGILVITGGPGTGKTTTIKTILNQFAESGIKVELAAPTGRAAKRMTEATGREAKTIHRLLGLSLSDNFSGYGMEMAEENKIEADALIIDEMSMVDVMLMFNLLKAIPHGTRLLLVGDADQLPSVGPGNVLKDMIMSGVIKTIKLTEIFRQAQESAIVTNAHKINHGEYPAIDDKASDFFFMKRSGSGDVVDTILELAAKRLPDYIKCDRLRDIQVLTPMRKGPLGVASLNPALQKRLNPPDKSKAELQFKDFTYREGDKVMQVKNNYNLTWSLLRGDREIIGEGTGVYNGDEGLIRKIDTVSDTLDVLFDDGKLVRYDFAQLEELELSYAITIHKSQGSEYKAVIIPVHSGPPMLLSRNLLYTALTRAKELAVLVGVPNTLYRMIDNDREVSRYSALCIRLQQMDDNLT